MATVENLSTVATASPTQTGWRNFIFDWIENTPRVGDLISTGLRFTIADVDEATHLLYGYTLNFTLAATATYDVEDNDSPAVAVYALKVPEDTAFATGILFPPLNSVIARPTAAEVITGQDNYTDSDWICVGTLSSTTPLALGVEHSIPLGEEIDGAVDVDVNMNHAWKNATGTNQRPPWIHTDWGGEVHLAIATPSIDGGSALLESITLTTIGFPSLTGKEGPWRANSRVSRCNRCSGIMPREMFIKDGFKYPLLVCPDCWDPRDPWESGYPLPREGKDREEYE